MHEGASPARATPPRTTREKTYSARHVPPAELHSRSISTTFPPPLVSLLRPQCRPQMRKRRSVLFAEIGIFFAGEKLRCSRREGGGTEYTARRVGSEIPESREEPPYPLCVSGRVTARVPPTRGAVARTGGTFIGTKLVRLQVHVHSENCGFTLRLHRRRRRRGQRRQRQNEDGAGADAGTSRPTSHPYPHTLFNLHCAISSERHEVRVRGEWQTGGCFTVSISKKV